MAPERAREGAESKALFTRQVLEASLRFHALVEPERLVPVVSEALRQLLGPSIGLLVLRTEAQEMRHPIGGREAENLPYQQVSQSVNKAVEAGQPVVDGQGLHRSVAVPLTAGSRSVGALYVQVADLERRFGTAYLDGLTLLAKHLGVAFDNASHVKDLASVSGGGGEDPIPPGLSLSDSKKAFERKLIRSRLREARGNIAAAARSLDMDRGQLSRLLKKHGIDKTQYRQGPKPAEAGRAGESEAAEDEAS
jgi:hypothetical protein